MGFEWATCPRVVLAQDHGDYQVQMMECILYLTVAITCLFGKTEVTTIAVAENSFLISEESLRRPPLAQLQHIPEVSASASSSAFANPGIGG